MEDIQGLAKLPPELKYQTLLRLDTHSLLNACAAGKTLQFICDDDILWKYKSVEDYFFSPDIVNRIERDMREYNYNWYDLYRGLFYILNTKSKHIHISQDGSLRSELLGLMLSIVSNISEHFISYIKDLKKDDYLVPLMITWLSKYIPYPIRGRSAVNLYLTFQDSPYIESMVDIIDSEDIDTERYSSHGHGASANIILIAVNISLFIKIFHILWEGLSKSAQQFKVGRNVILGRGIGALVCDLLVAAGELGAHEVDKKKEMEEKLFYIMDNIGGIKMYLTRCDHKALALESTLIGRYRDRIVRQ